MTNRYLISFFSRSPVIPLLLLGIITLPTASVLSHSPLLAEGKTDVGSAEGETEDAEEEELEKFKNLEESVKEAGMKPEPTDATTEGIKNVSQADATGSKWTKEQDDALSRLLSDENLSTAEQWHLTNQVLGKNPDPIHNPVTTDNQTINSTGQNTSSTASSSRTSSGRGSSTSSGSTSSGGRSSGGSSSGSSCSRGGSCGGGSSGGGGGGGTGGILNSLLGGGSGGGGLGGITGAGGGILSGALGGMFNQNQQQNTQSNTQDNQGSTASATSTTVNPAAGLTEEERQTINKLCQGKPAGCRIGLIQQLKTTGSLTDEDEGGDTDSEATDEQPEDNSSSNSF